MTNEKNKSQKKYDKENTKMIALKINKNTEPELLDKILSVDNVNGYIKSLIRQDIEQEQ